MATTTSPGQVTPDLGPTILHPHVDSVTLTDNAFNSTAVIPSGAQFFLRVDMGLDGPLAGIWPKTWVATIFMQQIDVAAAPVVTLNSPAFTWPVASGVVTLGPFVAGPTVPAPQQPIPSGLYRIAIDLDPDENQCQPASLSATFGGFIDGPVVEVIP